MSPNQTMIKLYNLDCMEAMKEAPDNYWDLAIVDPPYGIGEAGQRNKSGASFKGRPVTATTKYKAFNDSKIPSREYFEDLYRVSKNQIIWGGNYFTKYLPSSMGWIVWDKKVNIKDWLLV